jgi:L,D-peptidoglycan transpeptidase YkuD (ErfK/YbiS/YcfS/YnhG family)
MFSSLPANCEQLIVTAVLDRESHPAQVSAFEKRGDQWLKVYGPFSAVVGRKGITDQKKEGDERTPEGVYPLLKVFGLEKHRVQHMPFVSIHEHLEAVDDPLSRYYNQIVDRRSISMLDWQSSEKMQELGRFYEIGAVIGYNTEDTLPGKGSCIFLHVYDSLKRGTAGCTAVSLDELKQLVNWLNQDLSPHILLTVRKERQGSMQEIQNSDY